MMTKQEADRETLAYFDREHRKRWEQELEESIVLARTDRWTLGQLHMRSLENPEVAARLAREPELLRELRRKV